MRRLLLLLALALARTVPLGAQGLASPGPLTTAHARYDNLESCLRCHESRQELSGRKCLDCHASLAARISAGRGYHAQATRNGAELRCRTCHSEHNGRPYRLVRWPDNTPREQFDHGLTGYRLEGAHARLRCDQCHRAGLIADAAVRGDSSLVVARTYLGLGTACGSCHLDEHRGRTGRECGQCHTQEAWKPAPRFDHDSTRFRLEGRHRDVPCADCHETRRDVATGPGGARDTSFVDFRAGRRAGSGCTSCHRSPHRDAQRTARCEACHTVDGWFRLADSLRNFDHGPIGFPLRGAHARAECESCHLPAANAALPARIALVRANFLRPFSRQRMAFTRCADCHADVHGDQLSDRGRRDCSACHDETRFTPSRYAHETHDSTAFALTGAHAATPCTACHRPLPGTAAGSGRLRFRYADRSCTACHQDPHRGQFAGRSCEFCHSTERWDRVRFDHDSTRYPLRGAHVRVTCGRCHTRPAGDPSAPIRFRGLPTTCESSGCHGDPHGGQFAERGRGSACTTCHNEERWRPPLFDHQQDSDWPLDGAHRNVPCARCHRPAGEPPVVRFRPLPHRCEDCHAGERRR